MWREGGRDERGEGEERRREGRGAGRGRERDPLIIYSFLKDEEHKILCAERNPFETLLTASLTPNRFSENSQVCVS